MQKIKKSILLLDDDADIRELLSTVLTLNGYNVTALSNFDIKDLSAIPDVVLLDVMLSGEDGKDVCRLIKANYFTKNIPVIMLSGLCDAREKCLDAGADAFMLKPFNTHTLQELINSLLTKTTAFQSA